MSLREILRKIEYIESEVAEAQGYAESAAGCADSAQDEADSADSYACEARSSAENAKDEAYSAEGKLSELESEFNELRLMIRQLGSAPTNEEPDTLDDIKEQAIDSAPITECAVQTEVVLQRDGTTVEK